MNKKITFCFSVLLILATFFMLGFIIGQKHPQKLPVEPIKVKVDTLVIHDTTFVYLEREKVTWRDSLCEVYVSGIMASVDSVRHFQEYKYITIEKQVPVKVKSHWGLGVNAGYGVGKGVFTPYIGVGISYNLLSW